MITPGTVPLKTQIMSFGKDQDLVIVPCQNCKGNKYVGKYRCPSCNGSGQAVRLIHRR